MRRRELSAGLLGLVLAAAGCKQQKPEPAEPEDLPALRFDETTTNLVLTFLDESGGAHQVPHPSQVPLTSRRRVRVVVSDQEAGNSDPIYVADLQKPDADGSYWARSERRAEWEKYIDETRKEAPPRVADARQPRTPPPRPTPGSSEPAPNDPPPNDPPPSSSSAPAPDPFNGPTVIVYGADWCGPCHQALDYLKRKGIATTYKDIDKSSAARDEMDTKLKRVRGRRGSIPVLDVGGRILVGYSQGALDQALRDARGGQML